MVHTLTLNQVHDPQRGSFIVKDRPTGAKLHSRAVYVAPVDVGRDGSVTTYANSFEFVVAS